MMTLMKVSVIPFGKWHLHGLQLLVNIIHRHPFVSYIIKKRLVLLCPIVKPVLIEQFAERWCRMRYYSIYLIMIADFAKKLLIIYWCLILPIDVGG